MQESLLLGAKDLQPQLVSLLDAPDLLQTHRSSPLFAP